ncbi:hypothetical protein BP6252_03855 [Coleophoma cylindrospora]|uniref:Gylcosyl hydrolase 115 C-terminal domain-containing protein n=1 Tax=Coleophoma cylindrospora TaxID=1849047 RepID=A0A3D8S8X1_9HELO|nr:hypothetical protein BP6252_03855 [Coleophoma cylindrospora]
MKRLPLLNYFLVLLPFASALGQEPVLTTTSPTDGSLLQLAGASLENEILVSSDDWWGVIRAAEDLASDFGKVTGKNLSLASWSGNTTVRNGQTTQVCYGAAGCHDHVIVKGNQTEVVYTYYPPTSDVNYTLGLPVNITGPTLLSSVPSKTVIIAGTIGKSSLISNLILTGKLNVSAIDGKWESFTSEVISSPLPGVQRALVVAGSDLRGTIFGLYDISEQMGVSPWWWFADVPVKKQDGVWALTKKKIQGPPSIKYRGIFINDEQPGLTNWISENYTPGKYGAGYNHFFYPRVFELLLRLRANYLWPAMWGSMFNVDDYENQPLADAFGIVMGTSHTEPMMRATNEWGTFGSKYGGNNQWEYDTNNASIIPFLTYGAQRAAPYVQNSLFTMAMRGNGDTAIDLTQAQAIQVLENVVAEQTKILKQVFNNSAIEDIPQMWCLYKEVQGYFEAGMSVPEYITLLWSDDNWGNVRRLPLANETDRVGGAGVYYHVDYVGDPRKADRIWILNVGDLKPLEIPINHFMDLAYDTPKWGYSSVPTWLEGWASREFEPSLAANISSVMDRYGMYAARRKYELIDPTIYSVINYNEADAVLAQWTALAKDAQAIYDQLNTAAQPAFYEMVLQPVLGGQVVHQIYVGAAKNAYYTEQKRNAANSVAMDVLKDFQMDHAITQRYHDLLGGKWNHMLDQTHLGYDYWQQPMRNALPPLSWVQELETSLAGNIGVTVEGSNATVSGDDMYHSLSSNTLTLPPMDPYGPSTRWIDIFARGTSGCGWKVAPGKDWVMATPSSGTTGGNGSDTRVYLSVDWSRANTSVVTINVTSSCATWGNYGSPKVQLPVNLTSISPTFTSGFVESDGHISIEAEHATANTSVNGVQYITIPSYGRTLSGVTIMPVIAPSQPAGTGPVLQYKIYTFTPAPNATLTLYLSPSLNQNGALRPLKYAVQIDAQPIQTVQFVANATNGNLPTGWTGAVADAVWGLSSGNSTTTTHNLNATGEHTISVWAVEPGVVFQKLVLNLGGLRKSYLGPPESFRAGVDTLGGYKGLDFAGGVV